jgi:hypothetical protein
MSLHSLIYLKYEFCLFTFLYQTLNTFISALKMCVYLMSRVALRMDLEDGVNITVQDLVQSILQVEELGLPRVATNIFTLWMCSGLLGNNLDSPVT